MKRFHLHSALSLTLAVLSAGSIAFAAPATDSGKMTEKSPAQCQAKRAEMRQKFAKELGLSTDQQAKIDALRSSFFNAHKSEFEAKHAQYKELRAMKDSGASQAQIDAKREALHQQFAGLKADSKKLHEQILAVLTPEQAQKFQAMKAKHHHHHRHDNSGTQQPAKQQ